MDKTAALRARHPSQDRRPKRPAPAPTTVGLGPSGRPGEGVGFR